MCGENGQDSLLVKRIIKMKLRTTSNVRVTHLFIAAVVTMVSLTGCGRKESAVKENHLTWEQVLRELVDLESLPDLRARSIQMISSFDRSGGNDDFNNFAAKAKEAGWVVLANLKGPGCLRRFWMTGTDPGHQVRIFIDGEKTPRIDSTFDDLFGFTPPWTPPLAQFINICRFSYIPVTYNESMRIETREPTVHPFWGPRRIFFQLSIESFPPDTSVESYPRQFTAEQLKAVEEVAAAWTHAIEHREVTFPESAPTLSIKPGQSQVLFEQNGSGVLKEWSIQLEAAEAKTWLRVDQEYIVQDAVLRVFYDGQTTPSIEVPAGDFFANAWRKRTYGSLWFTSGDNGYTCRLPMPYGKSIRIELENGSDRTIQVRFNSIQGSEKPADAGYLHAEYRRSAADSTQPHVVTRINGRGKYLGCFLGITGIDQSWWILEGDERIWVDGNSQPVWHGTGLEDYFNGGWYYRGVAFGALNGNYDRSPFRVSQFRHQGPDPVGFTNFFQFEFERMNDPQSGLPVKGHFQSVAYAYVDQPVAVARLSSDRNDRRAVINPLDRPTFMLQLVELERANDFIGAIHMIDEYIERYSGAEENGIYLLRKLEYRRLLGEPVTLTDYQPFLAGEHGETAKTQAELITWFHEQPDRAIVGMNVNGRGRLSLNGQHLLAGDHPFNLFFAGVELTNGIQQIAAQVDYQRSEPWVQVGIRMHEGFVGTGLGETLCSRTIDTNWRTAEPTAPAWKPVGVHEILRGVPDAPFIGGIPNAFVLVQSKSYPIRGIDWGYHQGTYYFRQMFDYPTTNWPTFSQTMTGLSR